MLSNCLESGGPVLSEAHGRIKAMQRQRGELVPLAEVNRRSARPGPGRSAKPVRRRNGASPLPIRCTSLSGPAKRTPREGFMARLMALCSLPRSNPGNRHRYVRRNGPYTLIMYSSGEHKLPFGNLPRLLLAWVCTEAVRTQNRVLIPGAVAFQVHADPGNQQRQRRPARGANPSSQSNEAAV